MTVGIRKIENEAMRKALRLRVLRHVLTYFVALAVAPIAQADDPGDMVAPGVPAISGGSDSGADAGWAVMSGASLKGTLEAWSRNAGWTLVWDSGSDYELRASATFEGRFEEAVGKLVDGIYASNPHFTATLYRGNRVLHIEDQSFSRH